ncbi:MAG: hypothetical protein HP496_14430 [Nitrospira sp.]|nr:hypothetical protein [Nitrospira sp.]
MREREETCSTDQAGETTHPVSSMPGNLSGDAGRLPGLALLLNAGAVYFVVAFGAGFVFEIIRLQVVALHISGRIAAVMETPTALLAMIIGAQWVIDRFHLPPLPRIRLGIGFVALCLMILIELMLILPLHDLSLNQYFATQDFVVGVLPVGAHGSLTAMPLLVGYRWER